MPTVGFRTYYSYLKPTTQFMVKTAPICMTAGKIPGLGHGSPYAIAACLISSRRQIIFIACLPR